MRKIGYIAIIGLLLLFLIPNGGSRSKVYLRPTEYLEKRISN